MQTKRNINVLYEKASQLQPLDDTEIKYLLNLNEPADLKRLFSTACNIRERYFQKKIFLYGFIYFSTWCRNNCTFCYYRKDNKKSCRYRRSPEEIIDAAKKLADSGVHLIDLTSGEDPLFYESEQGFDLLFQLVRDVKRITGLPVMVSPGVLSKETLEALTSFKADWYACYQETYNHRLFRRLRYDQSYEKRLVAKKTALNSGLLIEEGILTGIGDTTDDVILSLHKMRELGAQQLRVMSFVPQKGTPMEKRQPASRLQELKIIAVLRLLFPDRLIPASLDVDGFSGLAARLAAGANVVTSIIPPKLGLAGVAQSERDINEGKRTAYMVRKVLESMGLYAAELEEYKTFVSEEKAKFKKEKKTARACL